MPQSPLTRAHQQLANSMATEFNPNPLVHEEPALDDAPETPVEETPPVADEPTEKETE